MNRLYVFPRSLDDIPLETSDNPGKVWQPNWAPGTSMRVLAREESDGEIGGSTHILTLPPGYHRPAEHDYLESHGLNRFEHHHCHEEVFILEGALHFGDWYTLDAMSCMYHPPFWLHPANQFAPNGVTLLAKNSRPVDFLFQDIPPAWKGEEYVAPGYASATQNRPITKLSLTKVPWGSVLDESGSETGIEAKHIRHDTDDGWVTWLMRVPPGWRGSGPRREFKGGDEMLLLDGDLTVGFREETIRLEGKSYYSDPERIVDAGDSQSSETGAIALRFTRGHQHLKLPMALPAIRS
jgi:hypothetical protein